MFKETNVKKLNKLVVRDPQSGKIGIPLLLWVGGVPLSVVLLLWLFFFRG